jgi:hypothetical protein
MGFSFGRKEENMKHFNAQRVAVIAIDKREHQQLYVQDKMHRQKIFDTLFEMGFTTRLEAYQGSHATTPIVINTKEKNFHPATSGLMPFALVGGAKILSYEEMLELIDEAFVS